MLNNKFPFQLSATATWHHANGRARQTETFPSEISRQQLRQPSDLKKNEETYRLNPAQNDVADNRARRDHSQVCDAISKLVNLHNEVAIF